MGSVGEEQPWGNNPRVFDPIPTAVYSGPVIENPASNFLSPAEPPLTTLIIRFRESIGAQLIDLGVFFPVSPKNRWFYILDLSTWATNDPALINLLQNTGCICAISAGVFTLLKRAENLQGLDCCNDYMTKAVLPGSYSAPPYFYPENTG